MNLLNSELKFEGDPDLNIINWTPDYWHRREFSGNLYTYQLENNNNHGIRLYTSGGGLGSIFQVLSLDPGTYKLSGKFRTEEPGVGASMFICGFDEDESTIVTQDIPVQQKDLYMKYYPTLIEKMDGKWPEDDDMYSENLHVPRLQRVCKIGVLAGYGSGQYIDINHLSIEKQGNSTHLPDYEAKKADKAGCFYVVELVNNRTEILVSARVENNYGRDLHVYAAHNEINIGTQFKKVETWYPRTLGWYNVTVPPGKEVSIFENIRQSIPHGVTPSTNDASHITLYTSEGRINANHVINY